VIQKDTSHKCSKKVCSHTFTSQTAPYNLVTNTTVIVYIAMVVLFPGFVECKNISDVNLVY